LSALAPGPTGIGTASTRLRRPASRPRAYCPDPVRDNAALGRVVNDRLVDWAREVGIYRS